MTHWAVFDPNWGDPKPIPETIRGSEDEAKDAALWLEALNLYSGGTAATVPAQKGNWGQLMGYGFSVQPVTITECLNMPDEVEKLINVARIYFDDGAPTTAADRLRLAADQLTELTKRR